MTVTGSEWLRHLQEDRVDLVGRHVAESFRGVMDDASCGHLHELIEGVWWSGGDGPGGRAQTRDVVEQAIALAASRGVEAALALYIRTVCETAWDLTWDHGPILEVLSTAHTTWQRHLPDPGTEADLARHTLQLLRDDLLLETAVSTGDLRAVDDVARLALEHLSSVLTLAKTTPLTVVTEHLLGTLQERVIYIEAVQIAALTAADFLNLRHDRVDEAIAALELTELALAEDHASRSEIRAHRAALERLGRARGEDWLRVDEGCIVALFPFGLRHPDQADIVAKVKMHSADWVLAGAHLDNEPTALLLVDDVWRGDDPLKRRYDGTQLDLPDVCWAPICVTHATVTDEAEPITARVKIIISQLGNHHLRVELPLRDALPNTLAARTWLAAPEFGALRELGHHWVFTDREGSLPSPHACPPEAATCAAHATGWDRLSDLAHQVLVDLADTVAEHDVPGLQLSSRPGMFHVVTTIAQASVLPRGDLARAYPLDDAARLPLLFGSQGVTHPIPSGVGSVAFWARYATPVGTVVPSSGLTDEYLLVSGNHTLLASFTSPDYMVDTVGQAVEFVASLEGMFAAWQDELSHFYLDLTPHLEQLEATAHRDDRAAELRQILDKLEIMQLRLRQFITAARVSILFISSPALVTSPVMRETIGRLLELNQVWQQRADFTDVAGQALSDRVTDLIETWKRRIEERRDERNRLMIDTMLAVVAGIGLSGVLAMVQEGFQVGPGGSTVLVILVLALAATIGYLSNRWARGLRRASRSSVRRARGKPMEAPQ